jgi:hypothetical protein
MSAWRPLEEIGDVAYADWLVKQGIEEDDFVVVELRKRRRKATPQESMFELLRRELRLRGWSEYELMASRTVPGWKHADGEKARSLSDAVIRQLVREVKGWEDGS